MVLTTSKGVELNLSTCEIDIKIEKNSIDLIIFAHPLYYLAQEDSNIGKKFEEYSNHFCVFTLHNN